MHRDVPDRYRLYAKAMRSDSTKAENMLWQAVRNRQIDGFKFRRQVPAGGYILDFVCFEAHLIIEVDGGQHAESQSDASRTLCVMPSSDLRAFGYCGSGTMRLSAVLMAW